MSNTAFSNTSNTQKRIEARYNRYLRKVFTDIDSIIKRYYTINDPLNIYSLTTALNNYVLRLTPYAEDIANDIITALNLNNLKSWQMVNKTIGQELKRNFNKKTSTVFQIAKQLHTDEVNLIVTIPQDLAKKAQEMSLKAMIEGTRHEIIGEKISNMASEGEYIGRRIARTEIAKVNTMLTKARAESIGVQKFIWRTAKDRIVRDAHADLEGQIFDFNAPPFIEGEGAHLPGAFPNCRCYAEPIIT